MSYGYAMSSDRNEWLVYRAGLKKRPPFDDDVNTDKGPTFDDDENTVKGKCATLNNIIRPHPRSFFISQSAKKSTASKGEEKRELISELRRSLKWVKTSPFECQRGVLLISFSMLVYAINVYLDDNDPKTPEDFNFQAEIKAASHWDWLDDENRCLELGPYDDRRVKLAAERHFINGLRN
ncbi:unnamed protein product [Porites evermanni]|uniref:Uncharacterized protein n=1 Tax=Porites evermanni TaxID=104178 RepID=A0ABN8LGG7_9CNID|nr:unnamed protein product [Porites evermanni]